MSTSKEATVCRKRGRVNRLEDMVTFLQNDARKQSKWQNSVEIQVRKEKKTKQTTNQCYILYRWQRLSSERTRPTAWRPGPPGSCSATALRRPWRSPILCLCASWPDALAQLTQRSAAEHLQGQTRNPCSHCCGHQENLSKHLLNTASTKTVGCVTTGAAARL